VEGGGGKSGKVDEGAKREEGHVRWVCKEKEGEETGGGRGKKHA